MIQGYNWDIIDTYAAQSMCPYETVSDKPIVAGEKRRSLQSTARLVYHDLRD